MKVKVSHLQLRDMEGDELENETNLLLSLIRLKLEGKAVKQVIGKELAKVFRCTQEYADTTVSFKKGIVIIEGKLAE